MKTVIYLLLISGAVILCLGWVWSNFEFSSPLFAFLVNWLFMAWVAISGQIVSFPLLTEAYYAEKAFEKTGRVYEIIGMRIFKNIVRRPPFTLLSPTLKFPAVKTEASLQALKTEMKKAETGHLLIFLVVSGLVIYALLGRQFLAALWLGLFNLAFNGYPVALQRYNRIKLRSG
jgi:hypothetical protein